MAHESPSISITVLAHNEERRIAACLASLPIEDPAIDIHVVVNGSVDRTADLAADFARCRGNVHLHIFKEGGKARSWNRVLFDELGSFRDVHVFVDGDAAIAPGSVDALVRSLMEQPAANAASGFPKNGRNAHLYQSYIRSEHGMFGDLYALRGSFIGRMGEAGVRLPIDLIGDDGLIGALAKTDLGSEDQWDESRVVSCAGAGFYCEPASIWKWQTLRGQYRRMINYSERHFQNRIVSHIMRTEGPAGFPDRLARLYPEWLPRFEPRRDASLWWFDRAALRRMARRSG